MAGGSFGARACKAMRKRYLESGILALPRSWRKSWMIARIVATPPWADMKEIRKVYELANRRTQETGVPHEVDHIIPLQHPDVCGLHVEWNLQVLDYRTNAAKSNRWMPNQLELNL